MVVLKQPVEIVVYAQKDTHARVLVTHMVALEDIFKMNLGLKIVSIAVMINIFHKT